MIIRKVSGWYMAIHYKSNEYLSEFLQYLAEKATNGEERLPPLTELSRELGVSVASLREQLEVARIFGFVEVRPKTGIRWLPYQFAPSILMSVVYAITISPEFFDQFRDLRNHLESAYFYESLANLDLHHIDRLMELVEVAENKMEMYPPQLPHREHRDLHNILFSGVTNTFVKGIFSVYWEVYEAQGFSVISDLDYLKRVWSYHRRIVEAIYKKDYAEAFEMFLEHKDLMMHNPKPVLKQRFE
jgi:DNA-binding FadR family transcriptional regulator